MGRQRMIPGTADEVPTEVQEAADAYVRSKRLVSKHREAMNGNLEVLIEKMKECDIVECFVDDGEKRLTLTEKDTVKIVKRAKPDDGEDVEE